jgi:hypothetical protein
MHSITQDGLPWRTLPCPIPPGQRHKLQGVRLAGPDLLPERGLAIQRKVSSRGGIQVARHGSDREDNRSDGLGMKRLFTGRPRREDSAGTGSRPTEAGLGDGLDDEVWRRLEAIVGAAEIGDPDEFAGLWQSLEREVTDQQRGHAGVYVFYILEYRVHDILQRRPAPSDLHDLAVRASARYQRIIRPTEASLYDTLCTVFKCAPAAKR